MIIYMATNRANGKIYIGQTVKTLQQRQIQHIYDAKNGSPLYFARALRKYGFNNFRWEVLCCCFDIDGLNEMEVYFIALFNSRDKIVGYNSTKGGNGISGFSHTNKTKEKIRQAHLGKKYTKEHKQKISDNNARGMLGKHHSDETCRKIRDAHIGTKHTKKAKQKMSKNSPRLSGKDHPNYGKRGKETPMYGKHHSTFTKEKLRQANLGKKHSDATKLKMSKSSPRLSGKDHPMWGTHPSEETRKKLREAAKGKNNPMYGVRRYGEQSTFYGRHHSEETKEQIRLSLKKYWDNKRRETI